MIVPRAYRRRSPTIHAVQVTDLDVAEAAGLVDGRVNHGLDGQPLIWLAQSRIPARLGDYLVREHTAWFAMKQPIFEYAYEPRCDCRR